MKNFIQSPGSIQIVAPAGGVVGGQAYKQGGLIGVIHQDALEGDQVTLHIEGAFDTIGKKTGEAWGVGDKLYFDPADSTLTKTAGSLEFAGYAYAAALSADTLGSILLKM